MPKGRNFAPETRTDGVWFQHRGMGPYQWPPQRDPHTATGDMLTAPFKEFTAAYPPSPPQRFHEKHVQKNFKKSNLFSSHDNRNVTQSTGEYFGDGAETRNLGKRLQSADLRVHHSDPDAFYERQASNLEYRSMYNSSFVPHGKTATLRHRRFPRVQPEAPGGNPEKLSTTAATWFREPDVPYKTHLQVLASSQEPFLKHNAWKYSNHGLAKVYPPYDQKPLRKPQPLQTWLLTDMKPPQPPMAKQTA